MKLLPASCALRLAAAVSAASLCAALLSGCAGAKPAAFDAQSTQSAPTLRVMTVGSSGEEACARIGRALSAITQEKFGFAVQLQQAAMTEYDDRLSRQLLLGEAPDVFCYIEPESLLRYVEEGYVAPLDALLPAYPEFGHTVPSELWTCVRVDGKIYAVPANNNVNYSVGFLARADLVDQLGIDPARVTSWEQMHDVLAEVKAAYPDVVPVVPHFGQTLQTLGQDPLGDNLGVLPDNRGTKVENLYASAQYAETCARMHQWYEEGLILRDAALTAEAAPRMLKLYNGFGFFARISDNNLISNSRSLGQELVAFELSEPIANSSSINLGWCVSPSSGLQKQAMQLLALLYTDRQTADLCIYGESGVDYVRLDADTLTNAGALPNDEWSTIPWAWPNRQVASAWQLPDRQLQKLPLRGAQRSPAMGFVFDSAPVQPAVNRCTAVADKYHNVLMSGYLDPADALPRFLAELEQAGIGSVMQEKQRQLDVWLAALS